MGMTKEERAEKARLARAEKAAERAAALEEKALEEIAKLWPDLPEDERRVMQYIEREIPKRDLSDRAFLRETREIRLRPYRVRRKKAA